MNKQLHWLKGIKESHGAVEVSALEQAKAINAHGMYLMGAREETSKFEVKCLFIYLSFLFFFCLCDLLNVMEIW